MKIRSIGLISAPSAGRSVLGRYAAERTGIPILHGYAETFINEFGPIEHPAEQLVVLERAKGLEEAYMRLNARALVETPAPLYAIHGLNMVTGKTDPRSLRYKEEFIRWRDSSVTQYDILIYLPYAGDKAEYLAIDSDIQELLLSARRYVRLNPMKGVEVQFDDIANEYNVTRDNRQLSLL